MGEVPHRRRALLRLMWAALVADLAWLLLRSGEVDEVVNGVLESLTLLLPVLVCWSAVPSAGPRRREVRLVAVAQSLFVTGALAFLGTVLLTGDHAPPFPSVADLFYLPTYVVLLGAVATLVRRETRLGSRGVLLDAVLSGLGAATGLSVVLAPALRQTSRPFTDAAISLAYPLFDLMLVAAVVGVVALHGLRRREAPLLLGLLVFTAADVAYALRIAVGSYTVGTPFDAAWAAGLTLMATWVALDARPGPAPATRSAAVLTVPGLATVASLGVLVWATRRPESALTIVLATLTLIATAGRTQLAFRELRRLADLRRQATTDELTGLPNRRAFAASVASELALPGAVAALLLLDLDRFKEVNDSLGHSVGDDLLQMVGVRLGARLREQDVLARLGGDEFAVLLAGVDEQDALRVATDLRAALVAPFLLDGFSLRTDVSIGVALAPAHGGDLSVLLRRADIAMYKAKRAQRGAVLYHQDDDAAGDARLRLLQELRTGLAGQELTLHHQPKLDLRTGAVTGVEALVRWQHPTRGLLYPDAFLSLAEDAGLMGLLTEQVLAQALDQAVHWRAQGRELTIAVNLSGGSLVDVDLPGQVLAQLAVRGLPPSALQLEITEDALMQDRERARAILSRLRAHGVQIAVDDFGTGYSSLAYLRDLPIDELKLDRSFLVPMASDARAAALVLSTIGLAHSLDLRIVAEGVEDAETLAVLAAHGCDQAQGYHVSRPVPAAALEVWLDGRCPVGTSL